MASLKIRGEHTITIGGRAFKMKCTFEALAAVEQDLNMGLLALMQRVANHDVRLKDVAIVFWHCAQAGGETLEFKEAGKLLMDNSYLKIAPKIFEVMSDAIIAGRDELPNGSTGTTSQEAAPIVH